MSPLPLTAAADYERALKRASARTNIATTWTPLRPWRIVAPTWFPMFAYDDLTQTLPPLALFTEPDLNEDKLRFLLFNWSNGWNEQLSSMAFPPADDFSRTPAPWRQPWNEWPSAHLYPIYSLRQAADRRLTEKTQKVNYYNDAFGKKMKILK